MLKTLPGWLWNPGRLTVLAMEHEGAQVLVKSCVSPGSAIAGTGQCSEGTALLWDQAHAHHPEGP